MDGSTSGWRRLSVLVVLAATIAGCATSVSTHRIRPAIHTAQITNQAGDLTAEQEDWLADLCAFGPPELGDFYADRPTTLLVTEGRAIRHDDQAKTAVWVCEHLRKADVHGGLTGDAAWKPDPVLCPDSASHCARGAVDKDYTGSGYDRGHLATNSNQRADEQRKRETFYLSNAGPQVGKGFNQSVWKDMEMELQEWVRTLDAFWTISGVLYHDEAEDDPDTADGLVDISTIGSGAVEVPTHFYKIAIWEDDGGSHAMAVVMANRKYPAGESFRTHIVPMRWIEERLDVDFLPGLDPADQDALEVDPGTPYEIPE